MKKKIGTGNEYALIDWKLQSTCRAETSKRKSYHMQTQTRSQFSVVVLNNCLFYWNLCTVSAVIELDKKNVLLMARSATIRSYQNRFAKQLHTWQDTARHDKIIYQPSNVFLLTVFLFLVQMLLFSFFCLLPSFIFICTIFYVSFVRQFRTSRVL